MVVACGLPYTSAYYMHSFYVVLFWLHALASCCSTRTHPPPPQQTSKCTTSTNYTSYFSSFSSVFTPAPCRLFVCILLCGAQALSDAAISARGHAAQEARVRGEERRKYGPDNGSPTIADCDMSAPSLPSASSLASSLQPFSFAKKMIFFNVST